jgi:hypothetical protein
MLKTFSTHTQQHNWQFYHNSQTNWQKTISQQPNSKMVNNKEDAQWNDTQTIIHIRNAFRGPLLD